MIAFWVLISANKAYASHAMAVDITYECVGPNTYVFCVNFYRDCQGIEPPPSVNLNFFSQSCNQNFTVNIDSTMTGLEVSQLCPDTLPYSTCNSNNLPDIISNTSKSLYSIISKTKISSKSCIW